MGKTTLSLDLYLKDVTKPTETILQFLAGCKSRQGLYYQTDNGDEEPSRRVFNKETFPYQEFGLTSLDFSKNEKESGAN